MDEEEFKERKAMLWAMFAAASLAGGSKNPDGAAKTADHMTDLFEGQFVQATKD